MPEQRQAWESEAPTHGYSPWALAVREDITGEGTKLLRTWRADHLRFDLRLGRNSLWLAAHWPQGGALLLRTTYCPGAASRLEGETELADGAEWRVRTTIGDFRVQFHLLDRARDLVHCTCWFRPELELKMPYWPVDLYPVTEEYDPIPTRGSIFAAQRGPTAGFLYLALTEPAAGGVLYLQNLTSLNDYCQMMQVDPDSRVGGQWPELGYTPPLAERSPMTPGQEVILSDAYLRFSERAPTQPRESAREFLTSLADIYPYLPAPPTEYHDWLARAESTERDLVQAPACFTEREGRRFLNAYVGTGDRRPESLVQLATLLPRREYQRWLGRKEELPELREAREGLAQFFDPDLGTILRYRLAEREVKPSEGDEKSAWQIDSWYLYHPLANLARLATEGEEGARELFFRSLDYGIQVAQHFNYHWPVLFQGETLEVLAPGPRAGGAGETDVPGLYAYVMLQAHDLSGDPRYLREAKLAAESLKSQNFEVGYQFNNTAWGANAMLRLYRLTGDEIYLGTSWVCLASILHNTFLWECDYGYAKQYHTFFGLSPLHDGPYMAIYEEQEVFAAFHEYLSLAGEELLPSLQLLLTEYCRHELSRAWRYYPSELPARVLSPEVRNGFVDRDLAVPLEDIWLGWQRAGQVGQQVYGAGAAFAFVARSYHQVEGAPFLVFCDYPLHELQAEPHRLTLSTRGDARLTCSLRLIPIAGEALPEQATLTVKAPDQAQQRVEGQRTEEGHLAFTLPGGSRVTLRWKEAKGTKPLPLPARRAA